MLADARSNSPRTPAGTKAMVPGGAVRFSGTATAAGACWSRATRVSTARLVRRSCAPACARTTSGPHRACASSGWVGWEDAAPILRMARAPVDGRDQGADRGVLRGHLNQGLLPVHELREERPSGSSPSSSRRSPTPSPPHSGAAQGGGVRAAGAGSHAGDGGGRDELFASLADSSCSRKASLCAAA